MSKILAEYATLKGYVFQKDICNLERAYLYDIKKTYPLLEQLINNRKINVIL